ncbi:MAG: metallophosphoesterase [Phycisphaerae bacterium]|nr:metallophosphoesterase [Phycisphaerae bacterium]
MLICYTSDLHGSRTLYAQLGELVVKEQPRVVILGGDLLPDGDPDDPVVSQVRYIDETLVPRIARWREAVRGLEVAYLPGNHDWVPSLDAAQTHADAGRLIVLSLKQPWRIGATGMLGYACTPWTPHTVKDFERLDLRGDELPAAGGVAWDATSGCVRHVTAEAHFARLPSLEEELAATPEMPAPWIFVCHTPPHDTKLDQLPGVDHPIGSRAVRRFIEKRQPLLSLHGHVHESAAASGSYTDRIGRTLCVNPGQGHETLQAVLFDIKRPAETVRHTVFG